MAKKYFLGSVGTAEAFRYNNTKKEYEVAFVSKTLTDSTLNISTTKDDIRGGTGAPIQFSFYHDPNVEITLTDIVFDEKYIETQLGTKFDEGGDAYLSKNVTLAKNGTYEFPEVLAEFGGGCGETKAKGVWYSVDGGDWKFAKSELAGQTFTAPEAGDYCFRYIGYSEKAKVAEITSDFIPQELFLVITAPIYSGDACSASKGNKAGTITYEVPRFKLNGTQEFTMNMSQNQTMQLSGVALASESGCDITGSKLLRIITVITDYDPYEEAKAIFIDQDAAESTDIPHIMMVYNNDTVGIANNTNLTFYVGAATEGTVGTASGDWASYITDPQAGETYHIKVVATAKPALKDEIDITIPAGN